MTWQSRMVLGSIFAVVLVIGLPDLSLGVGTCRDEKNCPCKEAEEAWKEYKKHLKVAEGLYDDAFGESDRALKEFDEAMDEVMGELGMIGGGMTGEEIASMVVERSLKEAAKQALSDLEMINTLGTEVVSDVVAVPIGAFAEPSFPPPTVSVFESRRHPWLATTASMEHHD